MVLTRHSWLTQIAESEAFILKCWHLNTPIPKTKIDIIKNVRHCFVREVVDPGLAEEKVGKKQEEGTQKAGLISAIVVVVDNEFTL